MIRSVVVAVDGTASARHALELACEVAGALEARLVLLSVAPSRTYFPPGKGEANVTDHEVQTYKRMSLRWAEKARARGIASVETVNLEGMAADAIVEYAEQHRPDLLVVGARALSGARRMFFGGVSTSVVSRLPCPVLVVPEPPEGSAAAEDDPEGSLGPPSAGAPPSPP
jgi:nucleotide-binding universal stress UspA family protein